MGLIAILLNLVIFLLVAPLAMGLLGHSKARLQLRHGPSLLQQYRDMKNLWAKHSPDLSIPSTVFAIAPYIALFCYIFAGALIPVVFINDSGNVGSAFGFPGGDLVLLIYLLGLATFVIALGGMDSGASFGHMGSSRSMFVHVIVEPGLILSLAALAFYWNTTDPVSIETQMQTLGLGGVLTHPSLLLIAFSFIILILAEAGRLPFDNPATHLELTMSEHAVGIEYGGRHWAALKSAEMLKMLFLLTLLIDLFVPGFVTPLQTTLGLASLAVIAYPIKLCIAILFLAVWESLQGQFRLRAAIRPALLAVGLALCSIVLTFTNHIFFGGR
jgi:formate hydrogenlyase subunit 4